MIATAAASRGIRAVKEMMGGGTVSELIGKVVGFVANVVKLAVIVVVVVFLYRNPPRPAGPHNFQRKSLTEASEVFAACLKRFWRFYGERMEEWWSDMVSRATGGDREADRALTEMCDAWKERGRATVFNALFLDNNKPSEKSGDLKIDVRTAFYKYPGRSFRGHKDKNIRRAAGPDGVLDIAKNHPSVKWPSIGSESTILTRKGTTAIVTKPDEDFMVWYDLDRFDPRQVVAADDPGYNLDDYLKNMHAVERYDLMAVAIPAFVDTLYAENSVFRHVPVDDLDDVVAYVRDNGLEFESTGCVPEFLLRYGVKNADQSCLAAAAKRLSGAAERIDAFLLDRIHAAVSSNTALAKSVARGASPEALVDFGAVTKNDLACLIWSVTADKGTALYFAARALKGWGKAKTASEDIAKAIDAGNVNTLGLKQFVRESGALFESAMTDFMMCLRLAEDNPALDKDAMAAEYTLWHSALDLLRAVEDDTFDVTIAQLRALDGMGAGSKCKSYRELYKQYVNAVKCGVYAESYMDDAKAKWNVRYTNPLAAEHFYKTYFSDIATAYWSKNDYETLPSRDCDDCFKPYLSDLGNIYNVESVSEYTRRFWQSKDSGIGRELVLHTKRMLSSALRGSLVSCEFSTGFVRKILGEEFDGNGYYGGTTNKVWIYKMSHEGVDLYWNTDANTWTEDGEKVTMAYKWPSVNGGEEIVVEDCVQGGSAIYSRYCGSDGFHRFVTADEKGVVETDNLFRVDAMDFSACMHGVSRQRVVRKATVPINRFMSDANMIDSGTFSANKETFATEPDDYCHAPDGASADGPGQDGLFQLIDVVDPPDRMTMGKKRKCVILSKGKRSADPRYKNKRLLVIGYDPTTKTNRLALIDDTPDNRGHALITLESASINTTGEAVIGFAVKKNGHYPYFLDAKGERDDLLYPAKLTGLFILIGLVVAGIVLTALTAGAAGPVVAGFLVAKVVTITTSAAITATAGAAVLISGASIGVQQANAKKAFGVAIDTGLVISNQLTKPNDTSKTVKNPFIDRNFRYMLVLETPGLWPEFSLVPYTKPSKTIGTDPPKKRKKETTGIVVPRDEKSGASRVLLIQAKEVTPSGKPQYPPMISQHGPDNFSRQATPYYIYSPAKGMFLTSGKGKHTLWIDGDKFSADDIIAGRMPRIRDVLPFYLYEMAPEDLTDNKRKEIDDAVK